MNANDLKPILNAVKLEIEIVAGTLREKGAKRFQRALVVAGFLVFAAYMGVYAPPQKKAARLQSEINHAKQMAEYGEQYKNIRDQLALAYARLPSMNEREQWLSNAVRDSLNIAHLVTEDFRPVREQELNGLVFQSSEVALPMKFSELYDWILRLESARPMMHIQSVSVAKKTEEIGKNAVACEVATVIPKRRFK